MRCENCGVDMVLGAAFCPSCGRPAGSGPVTQAHETQPPVAAGTGLQRNVAGFLCYLAGFITGIFFLVAEPYKRDHFVRFHAFQAIFLSVAWFAVYFALSIFLSIVPGMLWRVSWMLHSVVSLGFFCLWLFLMFKAYNNELFKLPVIGDLAAKQA
jgi:uncharacterized membrane protein